MSAIDSTAWTLKT